MSGRGAENGGLLPDVTVAAGITARLIRHAVANGVPSAGLLARVGWRSPDIPRADARVSLATHWGVWRQVHEHGVPDDFGLTFGARFELDELGVLGMLMAHSDTVEEAMAQQIRFQRLLIDVPFKVTRLEPDKLVIEHPILPAVVELPHMLVAGLAFWLAVLCALVGEPVRALAVELPHAPLAAKARYRELLGVTPRFDEARVRLELDRVWWTARVRAAPSGLAAQLRTRALALLHELPQRGEQLDAVREYIVDELRHGRQPMLNGAAKRLGVSTRTLQRSLRAADLRYEALLDETRQQLSLEYLGDTRLTIGEVAVVLGYSEPATFYRAFKRWTGATPGSYRAKLA